MLNALSFVALALSPAATPAAPHAAPATLSAPVQDRADYERLKTKMGADLLEGLEKLVAYCEENKAKAERDLIYAKILILDPEHKDARKWLRYKKDRKTGKWVQRGYRAPKPTKDEAVVEHVAEQRALLDAVYVDEIFALVEEHAEALGPQRTKKEYEEILELEPNHEPTREALGFANVGEDGEYEWLPVTVVEARTRRGEIQEALEEARGDVDDPEDDDVTDAEDSWDVEWASVTKTSTVRVVTDAGDEELETVARNASLGWAVMDELVAGTAKAPDGFTIYICESQANKEAFIDNHPNFTEEDRQTVGDFGSLWLNVDNQCVVWRDFEGGRVDAASKQLSAWYLSRSFGIGRQGWIVEGFGHYYTKLVCGTRLSVSVVDTEYDDPNDRKADRDFGDPDANWFELASDLLEDAKPTRLVATLGKTVNEMTPADYVLAYTLAAYMIESKGRRMTADLLARVGGSSGKDPVSSTVALEEMLGLTIPELQVELKEWIDLVGTHDY